MTAEFPRLRPLDIRPIIHQGQPMYLLNDPLRLADGTLLLSRQVGPLLMLCDGSRDSARLRRDLARQYGLRIDDATLEDVLESLDATLLLDNQRFRDARAAALGAYRAAPFRPPAFADQSYPADPAALHALCEAYLSEVPTQPEPVGRGILSPHIDYGRGGAVYARVWKQVPWVQDVDLVVLLGTDHYGNLARFTLTRQHYATPYGVLPTALPLVDALADALGETCFAGELFHRAEHAIELVAVWLHHMRNRQPVDVLPVLCGSFRAFTGGAARDPASDPAISTFLSTLQPLLNGRKVAFVASGDMAHVGPAFGGPAHGTSERGLLDISDRQLIDLMAAGDAGGYCRAIQQVGDRNNICGLPPVYAMLRLLGDTSGTCHGYATCPADDEGTSFVTIAGMSFR